MLSTNTWRDDRIMSILTLTAWTTVQSSSTLVVEYRQRKIEEQRVLVERVEARCLEALGKRVGRPAHAGDADNERVGGIDNERATGVGDERHGECRAVGEGGVAEERERRRDDRRREEPREDVPCAARDEFSKRDESDGDVVVGDELGERRRRECPQRAEEDSQEGRHDGRCLGEREMVSSCWVRQDQ